MNDLASRKKSFFTLLIAGMMIVLALALTGCGGNSHENESQPPVSSSRASGMVYKDVKLQFENAGFTNVELEPLGDLVLGWMHKSGEVDEVSIAGDTSYSTSKWYSKDSLVVIRYHSYPDELTEEEQQALEAEQAAAQAEKEAFEAFEYEMQGCVGKTVDSICPELDDNKIEYRLLDEASSDDLTSSYKSDISAFANMVVVSVQTNEINKVDLIVCDKDVHKDQVKPPISSSDIELGKFQDAQLLFENAGFENITTEAEGDLSFGWLHEEGDVDEILIDGKRGYSTSDWFEKDAKVVIRYHSFPEEDESQEVEADDSGEGKVDTSSLENRDLLVVCHELEEAGIPFSLIHDISNEDMTTAYQFGDFDNADMVVVSAKLDGEKVILRIVSGKAREEAKEKDRVRETLEKKLDLSYAWGAVEQRGYEEYPEGFNLKNVWNKQAEQPYDDDTWFLKAGCTVTYFGEKINCVCEAKVTGTSDNPEVISFSVY